MGKRKYLSSIFILFLCFNLSSCSGVDNTPIVTTIYPVINYWVQRTWDDTTPPGALVAYSGDIVGTDATDITGNSTSGSIETYRKLIFNFNVSLLAGATIKSAYFRIYLNSFTGTPPEMMLENINYGNTDLFPSPRNYDNEFEGYNLLTAISGTAAVTAPGWIQIDVTEKLRADLVYWSGSQINSQFRLSNVGWETTDPIPSDFSCTWSMKNDTYGNLPQLVIAYTFE
jgi:hypothetical protein